MPEQLLLYVCVVMCCSQSVHSVSQSEVHANPCFLCFVFCSCDSVKHVEAMRLWSGGE